MRGRKSRKKQADTVESSLPLKLESTKKEKTQYFTKIHEEAIVRYASIDDRSEKSVLYATLIQPAFDEMVDKIVYTYKFTTLPNIEDLKEECKVWLTTILDKFDTSKGSKAFSYFSVITKNWFIHKVKKYSSGKEVSLDEISKEHEEEHLFVLNDYDQKRESAEFWNALMLEIDSWDRTSLKVSEKKVYESIKILLKDPENIQIFNKKAIYLYIREITGLTTKQIVMGLKKFRVKYGFFKQKWDRGLVNIVRDNSYETKEA